MDVLTGFKEESLHVTSVVGENHLASRSKRTATRFGSAERIKTPGFATASRL